MVVEFSLIRFFSRTIYHRLCRVYIKFELIITFERPGYGTLSANPRMAAHPVQAGS